MPKSLRHQRAAERLVQEPIQRSYAITDPAHKPDMKGEFAGAKVVRLGTRQVVKLTDAQAKFYLDQGTIELLAS